MPPAHHEQQDASIPVLAERTVTRQPRSANKMAQHSPATPEPIISTESVLTEYRDPSARNQLPGG